MVWTIHYQLRCTKLVHYQTVYSNASFDPHTGDYLFHYLALYLHKVFAFQAIVSVSQNCRRTGSKASLCCTLAVFIESATKAQVRPGTYKSSQFSLDFNTTYYSSPFYALFPCSLSVAVSIFWCILFITTGVRHRALAQTC